MLSAKGGAKQQGEAATSQEKLILDSSVCARTGYSKGPLFTRLPREDAGQAALQKHCKCKEKSEIQSGNDDAILSDAVCEN